jgi:hypothetical protein
MTFQRIIFAIILVAFTACRQDLVCPSPKYDKFKWRASGNRMKVYKMQMRERAMAREKEAGYKQLRKTNEKEVKPVDVNEWDCPRPGSTSHMKMLEKQRRKLEKQNEQNLKKKIEKQDLDQPLPGTRAVTF